MTHYDIAILGAGFSGLGMAVQLRRNGIEDFVVLERATEVGGTWRDNTYPGAACDVRTDLYSFSFAPNPDWTRSYGTQPEILKYLKDTARDEGLYPHIRFSTELTGASWDDAASLWRITTSTPDRSDDDLTARVLISGHGPLIEPVWPDIAGLDTFTGTRFHSARWNHDADLTGKRIAVIGTGASAIQFVPELAKVAGQLSVFQRTPAWLLPRDDRPTSERRRWLFRRFPLLQRGSRRRIFESAELRFGAFRIKPVGRAAEALSRRFMKSQIADPELRDKLTPDYRIGCKRILISSSFYPAFAKPNVSLETSPITSVEGDEIVTADGRRQAFDVLIAGTGFNATQPPVARLITGRDGVQLSANWTPHMHALRGTTVAGFPNFFLLVGPNTALGHNSIVYIIEAQLDYVLQALRAAKGGVIEPRRDAQDAYNAEVQSDLSNSVWVSGGCRSYYLDATGRNTTLWPHLASGFRREVRRLDPNEYVITQARSPHPTAEI